MACSFSKHGRATNEAQDRLSAVGKRRTIVQPSFVGILSKVTVPNYTYQDGYFWGCKSMRGTVGRYDERCLVTMVDLTCGSYLCRMECSQGLLIE